MEKIEILGLEIFKTHVQEMSVVDRLQRYFKQDLGWHYFLDLAWIIREVSRLPKGSLILDAGAGNGLVQFALMELGYNVISVDFANRCFGWRHLKRYRDLMFYINNQSGLFDNTYTQHLQNSYNLKVNGGLLDSLKRKLKGEPKKLAVSDNPLEVIERERYRAYIDIECCDFNAIVRGNAYEYCGRNFVYKSDLKDMSLLPDNYVDGVISVSALEHNSHADFETCVTEIERVVKPDGVLVVTVSASQTEDWFHEPSKGWCYSEKTLKRLFGLSDATSSNFSEKDELFEQLRTSDNELHRRLAPFYSKSGDNGMPWGKWDPQYQPVGIVKTKT